MKKVLCLICVLVFGITCFTGCGKIKPVVEEPIREYDLIVKPVGTIDVSDLSKIDIEGVSVEGNTIKIVGGADVITMYNLTGGNTDVKLVIDTTNSGIDLFVEDSLELTNKGTVIEVIGENGFQLYSKGSVTLIDTFEYVSEDERQNIINSTGKVRLAGEGAIILNSQYGNGIYASEDIEIDGSSQLTLDITSVGDCISSAKVVNVNPKSLKLFSEVGKGITAEGNLTVDNGTIVIQAGDEGIESKGILSINGGVLDITSDDDALNAGTPDALKEEREALNPGHPEMPEGEMPPQWNGENSPPMPEKKPEFNGGKARIGGGGHRKMPELPEGVTPGMAPEKILGIGRSSHNWYIQILLQVGIIGYLFTINIINIIWKYLNKMKNNFTSLSTSGFIIGMLVWQCFEVAITQNNIPVGILAWFVMGIGINHNLSKLNRKENYSEEIKNKIEEKV